MSHRPRIGITSGLARPHWEEGGTWWRSYAAAVEKAGGAPVYLDAGTRGREEEVLDGLDGILFPGGRDIDLALYPNPHPLAAEEPAAVIERYRLRPEPDRDAYELPLMQAAIARDLPVLGICRGCQVLNVALGGHLILDIPRELGTAVVHTTAAAPDGASSFHALRVLPETLLATVLEPDHFTTCNSRHHQSARPETPERVRVAAVCPEDGIVEAIEVTDCRWAVGVQWHPEHPDDPETRERFEPLFHAFVDACR